MIKYVYQSIIGRLKAKNTDIAAASYSPITFFDRYKGQYQVPADRRDFVMTYPAVLIEQVHDWEENAPDKQQIGRLSLFIHIVQEDYSMSFDGSEDQTAALGRMDFPDAVNVALMGFKNDKIGFLKRIKTYDDNSATNEIVTIIEYTASLTDDSASEYNKRVDTDPETTTLSIDPVKVVDKIKAPEPQPSRYSIE
jgi:hypothetical protein